MELTFDDDKMEFYPTFQDLEDVVLGLIERISETLQVLLLKLCVLILLYFSILIECHRTLYKHKLLWLFIPLPVILRYKMFSPLKTC